MNDNDIVKNIESWSKFLADLFKEPEIIDALAAIEKRKPGTLANFEGDKLIDEGEPLQENVISYTPVVTEAQEATTEGLVDATGGLVETPQSEKSRIMKKVKEVKAHLENAGKQRSTGIPAKDELNINNTSEEVSVEPVPVEAVPTETPQVEEVDEPVIQSLPDVVSTGETAPMQETQEAKPEVQPLPGVDVTNEQNVNNQSVENTVNNDVSSLSDVDVATTAVDMANQSLASTIENVSGEKGKDFVKKDLGLATKV